MGTFGVQEGMWGKGSDFEDSWSTEGHGGVGACYGISWGSGGDMGMRDRWWRLLGYRRGHEVNGQAVGTAGVLMRHGVKRQAMGTVGV